MIVLVARADAVPDGLFDIGELAAPQPVVVVEIGIALGPAAAGAVARRAIIGESDAPLRAREIEQLRIVHDVGDRGIGQLGHHWSAQRFELLEVGNHRAARVPGGDALRRGGQQRPGRIDDPIADRPDDGDVERPQPPARQRRVEFVDAVPIVARGLGAGDRINVFMVVGHRLVLPQRNACVFFELLFARRPQRVGKHGREDRHKINEAPGLGELGYGFVGRVHRAHRMLALSSYSLKSTCVPSICR
jgi:hypothetical protein